MAIEFNPVSRTLPRAELSRFLPNDRAMRAFEDLVMDLTETVPEAIGGIGEALDKVVASPVTLWQASDTFTAGRVVGAGTGISVDVTPTQLLINLRKTGVAAGAYGSAAQTVSVQVDDYGRVLDIAAHHLVSDNVAEGDTNLFFTDGRARDALSGGTGIDYNSATGEVGVDPTVVAVPEYGTWTPTDASGAGLEFAAGTVGRYARIGRLVWVTATVMYPATGSTAAAIIGGLPFAGAVDPDVYIAAPVLTNAGITFGANIQQAADAKCYFRDNLNAPVANVQLSDKFTVVTFSYLASE